MNRSFLFILLCLCCFSGFSQSQSRPDVLCEYLAYEPFDYDTNTPLHGLNRGEGFNGLWQVQNSNTDIPGYQTTPTAGSLNFTDLVSAGNHIEGGTLWLTAGRLLDVSQSGAFSDYVTQYEEFIGAKREGQSLWMSVLMTKSVNNDAENKVMLHDSNISTCDNCTGNKMGVGYFGSNSDVGGQRKWSIIHNNIVYPTDINVIVGEAALLVVHFTFNTENTQIAFYVNPPDIGQVTPGKSPDINITTANPFMFRSLAYFAGQDPGFSALDEIRLAATYQCAVPDMDIEYHIPPEAIIVVTPTSGSAPLIVNFDGSQSINNSSGSLTYTWDFGDGSPVSHDEMPVHTYTISGGIITAGLTVTDINGKSHTAYQNITLLDANGNFPCLMTVTSVRKADCDGTNAHIIVNSEYNADITLSLNGTTIAPDNNHEYLGLDAGIYQLTAIGTNGCVNQYQLHIDIDSSNCVGWTPQSCAMEIGTNLPGFADWEPHRAMRNFMKNSRQDAIPYTNDCNCWSFDDEENQTIFSEMSFDAGGYPLQIPQTTTQGDILLKYFISANGANMPPGHTYVLLYEGNGTIELSGALTIIQEQANRIAFELNGDGTFWFQLTQSTLGNHVRNVRVLRLEDEFADITNEPFYSEFLNKIEPFSVLRYMDWQHTNNNPMVSWNQRTRPERFSYGTSQGVPYELIIQLANTTQKDVWICVPHAANDDFIMEMAQLFKDQLDPGINIYLEYSNEVWNWIFSQAQFNIQNNPFNLQYGRAMALKAKNVFDIWHQVFSDEKCRVKRVLGIQAGFNWLNEQILAHLDQDDWDYGSPTHYFGLDHEETGNPRLDVLGASATVSDIMANAMNNFNSFREYVKQDYRNIQIYGKEIITYEGGQHFVGNVFGIPYEYQQAMWDAQSSIEMYDMYRMIHDSIRSWGCKLAVNFSLAGPQESIYGSWGVMETIDIEEPYIDTAPKYQALLDSRPDGNCLNTNIWTGHHSALWSDKCNWSKAIIPDESTHVIIRPGYQYAPEVDITTTVASIQVVTDAEMTVLSGNELIVLEE